MGHRIRPDPEDLVAKLRVRGPISILYVTSQHGVNPTNALCNEYAQHVLNVIVREQRF